MDTDIFRKCALKFIEVHKGTPAAQDRPPGAAVFAAPTARSRSADDRIAQRPALYLVAKRDDPPRVLVPSNGSRPPHTLEYEVQVRSADPAVADLDENIAPADRGHG